MKNDKRNGIDKGLTKNEAFLIVTFQLGYSEIITVWLPTNPLEIQQKYSLNGFDQINFELHSNATVACHFQIGSIAMVMNRSIRLSMCMMAIWMHVAYANQSTLIHRSIGDPLCDIVAFHSWGHMNGTKQKKHNINRQYSFDIMDAFLLFLLLYACFGTQFL